MVNAVYILTTTPGTINNINDLLKLISGRTQYVKGCVQSGIWHNDDTSEIMVSEVWKSRTDLDRYITSPLYKRMLSALELSAEKPSIRFYECDKFRGIDLIEEAMSNNANQ